MKRETLELNFKFSATALATPTEFIDRWCGLAAHKPVLSVDTVAVVMPIQYVPVIIAAAVAEGVHLTGVSQATCDSVKRFFAIEVCEIPNTRGVAGRRVGFIDEGDFAPDTRTNDEIIRDGSPVGDLWSTRDKATAELRKILTECAWTKLFDLSVVGFDLHT